MNAMIDITIKNSFAILTLNSPPVNTLSKSMVLELKEALAESGKDKNIKAVIMTGAGRFFCAGADIKEIALLNTAGEGMAFSKNGQELMDNIEALSIPVIAAINGACIGGGNELAMACHIRIASEDAWFSQPEINLGIIPGFGGTQRLPEIIGTARAVELILTGCRLTANEAYSIGLLNRVVASENLMKEAIKIAEKISSKGKPAIASSLKAIYGIEKEANLFGGLCETEDKKEGIQSFMEKRQPLFKDR